MKYKVSGYCYVPMLAEVEVEADSITEAKVKSSVAWSENKRALIVCGTEDLNSAFGWQPIAEGVE